jgi:tetratricopeptide (TPR) repeat protein
MRALVLDRAARRGTAGSSATPALTLILVLALLMPASAAAVDDAGSRSIFATGAGNRALAMGGAFGAIADDASALTWNPGGLGLVRRPELQFAQSSLAFGFRESWAGAVWPNWRWGTLGLSWRQFGTDEIDARDDRNLSLGDLSERESEIALAYGRPFGEAWSSGVVFKLQRQDVAGRAAAGVGADLGMVIRPAVALGIAPAWTHALSAGLSVRNVIEPQVRLDQETVHDPAVLRVGVAGHWPAFTLGSATASLEMEHTPGTSPRLHAGIEATPVPMFALRAGWSDRITAGTGLRWRNGSLDYSFEDSPLGATHRAGLTVGLGRTVAEERAAAARAEDERIEARMAESYRLRELERVRELLRATQGALDRNSPEEALERLATVRTLDSSNADARVLASRVWAAEAGSLEARGDLAGSAMAWTRALAETPGDSALLAARSRIDAERERRAARTETLRRQFDEALAVLAGGDLARARDAFAAVLRASPQDAEARAMLDRVEATIRERVRAWTAQARRLAGLGAHGEALRLLDQGVLLAPAAPEIAEVRSLLAGSPPRPKPAVLAVRSPEPAPPVLTPQQKREVAELYRRGLAAMERGHPDDAVRYWELVHSIQAGYQQVEQYLEREYQARGMEAFAAGRLEEAVTLWERALRIDPDNEKTRGYLARAQEQLARAREISRGSP